MGARSIYRVGLIILSDRATSGERKDGCIPVFKELLKGSEFEITETVITSDDPVQIRQSLESMIDKGYPLIFTSGGTGCSPRDNTPEVTSALIQRPTPGINEAIRRFSATKSAFAIYSRAVSGFVNRSLIINLPGSPNAVREILGFLLPTLTHPLELINESSTDCQANTDGTQV